VTVAAMAQFSQRNDDDNDNDDADPKSNHGVKEKNTFGDDDDGLSPIIAKAMRLLSVQSASAASATDAASAATELSSSSPLAAHPLSSGSDFLISVRTANLAAAQSHPRARDALRHASVGMQSIILINGRQTKNTKQQTAPKLSSVFVSSPHAQLFFARPSICDTILLFFQDAILKPPVAICLTFSHALDHY
jgi:hypothetical protein